MIRIRTIALGDGITVTPVESSSAASAPSRLRRAAGEQSVRRVRAWTRTGYDGRLGLGGRTRRWRDYGLGAGPGDGGSTRPRCARR